MLLVCVLAMCSYTTTSGFRRTWRERPVAVTRKPRYASRTNCYSGAFAGFRLWHQAHVREALSSRFGTKPLPFGFGKAGGSFTVSINLGHLAALP